MAEEFRKMNEKVERRNVLEIIRQGNEFASREDASHPADDARQGETRAGQVFSIATPADRERGMAERRWATRIAKEEVESNDGDEYMPPPGLDNRKRRALRRGRSATRRGRRVATEEKTEEATPRRSPISKEVGEPTPVPGDVAARPQENTSEAQTQTDVALPLRVEAVWQCHCVGAEAVVDAPQKVGELTEEIEKESDDDRCSDTSSSPTGGSDSSGCALKEVKAALRERRRKISGASCRTTSVRTDQRHHEDKSVCHANGKGPDIADIDSPEDSGKAQARQHVDRTWRRR